MFIKSIAKTYLLLDIVGDISQLLKVIEVRVQTSCNSTIIQTHSGVFLYKKKTTQNESFEQIIVINH